MSRHPKILVIDDDPTTCHLLETFLKLEQFQSSSVTHLDHNDIIATLDKEQPNLLLMDFHLVSRETLGYMLTIRKNEQWRRLPVIMTSAIDYRQKCIDAGASDFIVKPFNWPEIIKRIKALLENSIHQEA